MIKINLAKGSPQASAASSAGADAAFAASSSDESAFRRLAIKNLAIILLGPIALFVYEQSMLPDLAARASAVNKELTVLVEKNNHAKDAVAQTTKFKVEQGVLQDQIHSIENLKRDRLREVKILDFIQKDLPEKVWFSRIEMLESKLLIEGYSISDLDLTVFMEQLSRSAYLKDVSLIRSSDYVSQKFGALKKFEVSSGIERTSE